MQAHTIKTLLEVGSDLKDEIRICGWFRYLRKQSKQIFGQLYDGSSFTDLQCVFLKSDMEEEQWLKIKSADNGSGVQLFGLMIDSPKDGQKFELKVSKIIIFGLCDMSSYPLVPKKGFTLEYYRQHQHLRSRAKIVQSITRISATLDFATHLFFKKFGFLRLRTPLITSSDCEGAGEAFEVISDSRQKMATKILEKQLEEKPHDSKEIKLLKQKLEEKKHFFGKPAYLTVSGQLHAETYACGMGRVYTFGPTFRAENSNTSRHLAEFWMVEPEMPFFDLQDNMQLAEEYVQFCIREVLGQNIEDLEFLEKGISPGLMAQLSVIADNKFIREPYSKAILSLQEHVKSEKIVFEDNNIFWGMDLGSEHEKYLVNGIHGGIPVILFDYPSAIKSFYMKENEIDDQGHQTVAAMDILVSGIGELIGGSQRETDLITLLEKMKDKGLDPAEYGQYLDLRRFGNVPHSGFGLGFERLIMLVTGVTNIRDTIPFPRYVGDLGF